MNGAILAGLTGGGAAKHAADTSGASASGTSSAQPVRVTTRSQASAEKFAGNDRVTAAATETNPEANREAVRGAGLVILGVKPHQIGAVAAEIAEELALDTVVISVAAGIETAMIEAKLPAGIRVVRAMPNTPSTIGEGATGIAAGTAADAEAMALTRAVFESVGQVVEVPESEISLIGGIAGSGPAHVYLLIEQMTAAAEHLGMAREDALAMVVQTFKGSIEMVLNDPEMDVVDLRRKVTSPNGTTEQSVRVLLESGLTEIFERAFLANKQRSEELAAENR